MDQMETGLRHRLRRCARQISDQHRHLKPIFGELLGALEQGSADGLRDPLDQLTEAIRAHFSLEDEMLFPALHGLRPQYGADLESLTREHEDFLAQLDRLGATLDESVDAFQREFDTFRAALREHEKREERIVSMVSDVLLPTSL